jgi:hypothetical protein
MYLTGTPSNQGFMDIQLNKEMMLSINCHSIEDEWFEADIVLKDGTYYPSVVAFKRDDLMWSDKWVATRMWWEQRKMNESVARDIASETLKLIYKKAPSKVYFTSWSILDLMATGKRFKEVVFYEDENGKIKEHISVNNRFIYNSTDFYEGIG